MSIPVFNDLSSMLETETEKHQSRLSCVSIRPCRPGICISAITVEIEVILWFYVVLAHYFIST